MENDIAFLRRRLFQERAAALAATHSEVRQRHFDFVAAYELRLLLGDVEKQSGGVDRNIALDPSPSRTATVD